MNTVADFAKFLFHQRPQDNAARLCLYQYLKNYRSEEEEFSPQIIEAFHSRILSFPHWREPQNKAELAEEIRILVEHFLEVLHMEGHIKDFHAEIAQYRFADQIQIVEITNDADLLMMAQHFCDSQGGDGDRAKVLPDQTGSEKMQGAVGLLLNPQGELYVWQFDRLATIRDGILQPLCLDRRVKYNAQLELAEGVLHHLETAPHHYCLLQAEQGLVSGTVLRGYTLHKIENFQHIQLKEKPSIYFPLKRLERFFVDRNSDAFYQEVTTLIEKTILLCEQCHPECEKIGSAALQRGQNVFANVYPDDKLLYLLLKELSSKLNPAPERLSWQSQNSFV